MEDGIGDGGGDFQATAVVQVVAGDQDAMEKSQMENKPIAHPVPTMQYWYPNKEEYNTRVQ